MVLGRDWATIEELVGASIGLVKGNDFARAGLEMACWDLLARREGRPLAALLGGTRTRDPLGRQPGDRADDRAPCST